MNKLLISKNVPYYNLAYAMYPFGSRVYGNIHPNSDWDYYLILRNPAPVQQLVKGVLSYTIQTKDAFQRLLDDHEAIALECYFLPKKLIEIQPMHEWSFVLDKNKMKNSFLRKMNECYTKSLKKFNSNNPQIGRKGLFHSLRIAIFGLQILKFGKIVNYGEANQIWESIYSFPSENARDYEFTYKPIYNKLEKWLKDETHESLDIIMDMLPKNNDIQVKKRVYQDSKK